MLGFVSSILKRLTSDVDTSSQIKDCLLLLVIWELILWDSSPPRDLGTEVSQWGSGAKPWWELAGQSPKMEV